MSSEEILDPPPGTYLLHLSDQCPVEQVSTIGIAQGAKGTYQDRRKASSS